MATYTAPTTRTTGALISASIWNTDIVENLKYFKDAPVFDGAVKVTGALTPNTNDGSALGSATVSWADLFLASGGVINFNNGDVTVTHSTNTLTFAGAASGYVFQNSGISVNSTGVVTSGFIDFLKGAAWDALGYVDATSSLAIGGYRSSQWNEIRFYTSGTQKMTLTSGGNVAIAATAKLYLDGVAGTGDTWIDENAANNLRFVTGGVTALQMDSAQNLIMKAAGKLYLDGGVDTYITESAANTIDVIAGGAGGVRLNSGATSWVAISDERAKTDLVPMTDALAKIASLRAVTGRYHTDEASKRRSFLIAQDVQMVLPEAVTVDHNGMLNLSYTDVIPLMVAAMQQQQQKIAALEARIH